MLYFAYGSNLDEDQMLRRCPEAELVGPAMLPNHVLCFAGFSPAWRGAVASVKRLDGWRTDGLLYSLNPLDLMRLDAYEGHPTVYGRHRRIVITERGHRVHAQVYLHRNLADPNPPGPAYFNVIRRAYRRHGFDAWPLKLAAKGLT